MFLLTGFLGSGKTTLLAHLLRQPQMSRTAVIINEFGAVGLDHELVTASSESLIELETGCLCCAVRGDLALTLGDLLARRATASVTAFERIVIETSGLADPAPILQLLMSDAMLAGRLRMAGVVTTVDCCIGLETLAREPQAERQVAVADTLVLTKSDMCLVTEALARKLADLNASARVMTTILGAADANDVLREEADVPGASDVAHSRWLGMGIGEGPASDALPHDGAIAFHGIVLDRPLHAITATLLLETLAEHHGRDLLRFKAILDLVESPDRPAVLHGVQHVFHPVTFLEAWPSADRRSRIAVIGRGLSRGWIMALVAALESEVANAVLDSKT
ncbi:MAG: GTP-binding protein [Hyphomicrobiaceae bacterium]